MFGKLNFGALRTAKENLHSEAAYIAAGYKRVEFVPQPAAKEGYVPILGWAEEDGRIVQEWVLIPVPEDEDIDDAEALQIILGGDTQ